MIHFILRHPPISSFNPHLSYRKHWNSQVPTVYIDDLTDFAHYDPTANTVQKNFLAYLYFCEDTQKEYARRGIDRQILLDTLHDLVICGHYYHSTHGSVGLAELPWLDRIFNLQLFRLGRLQFCMFPSEFDIPQLNIQKDDPVLEDHIPGGTSLLYKDCLDSFRAAPLFFEKHFPDFPREFAICHSWLLDDTLSQWLQPASNIVKFQSFFTVLKKFCPTRQFGLYSIGTPQGRTSKKSRPLQRLPGTFGRPYWLVNHCTKDWGYIGFKYRA